jgi:hypothetical protein
VTRKSRLSASFNFFAFLGDTKRLAWTPIFSFELKIDPPVKASILLNLGHSFNILSSSIAGLVCRLFFIWLTGRLHPVRCGEKKLKDFFRDSGIDQTINQKPTV